MISRTFIGTDLDTNDAKCRVWRFLWKEYVEYIM